MGGQPLPAETGAGVRVLSALRAYTANPDPLAAAANLVALVVVGNQPFYPLYIRWLVGPDIAPAFWTFLSTPFFAAVPWVARRNGLAGRVMMVVVGSLNSFFCVKIFGEASGTALFLFPCLALGGLLFRKGERLVSLALLGAILAGLAFLHGHYGPPLHVYTAEEYADFFQMNALSVATLTAFIGLTFAKSQE
jgi:hypothetical protein